MKELITSIVCILIIFNINAQTPKKISGKVIDPSGNPLPDVLLKTTDNVIAYTDSNGYYSLTPNEKIRNLEIVYGDPEIYGFAETYKVNEKIRVKKNMDLMLDFNGIVNRYWCCKIDTTGPHCAKNKEDLEETHDPNEKYVVRRR